MCLEKLQIFPVLMLLLFNFSFFCCWLCEIGKLPSFDVFFVLAVCLVKLQISHFWCFAVGSVKLLIFPKFDAFAVCCLKMQISQFWCFCCLLTEIAKSSLSFDTFANLLKWNCWILSRMFYSAKIKKIHIKQKKPECEIHLKSMRLILQEITNHIRTWFPHEAVLITTSRNHTWYQILNCSTKVSDHGNYVFRFFKEALVLQMLNHLNKTWG